MTLLLVSLLIIILCLIAALAIVGKRINLFSTELLNKYLPFAPTRWLAFFAIGLVWVSAKIRFPGTETIVTFGFDNRVGNVLRAAYWKARVNEFGKDVQIDIGAKVTDWKLLSIGDNSWIDRNVILETGAIDKDKFMVYSKKPETAVWAGELRIGKGCHISKNVVIQSCGGVLIGDYSGVASGAKIYSLSHHYKNMSENDDIIYKFTPLAPPKEQSLIQGPVVLEGNNAVGLNSVILPGVTIGKNSWIGACSCVGTDVPPNCLVSGCPAKIVKHLGPEGKPL